VWKWVDMSSCQRGRIRFYQARTADEFEEGSGRVVDPAGRSGGPYPVSGRGAERHAFTPSITDDLAIVGTMRVSWKPAAV